ncbi:MAG: PEP-CTERM sorting domain-containing protein [Armatimonadetes bacterium]|nr:PEP-CTERM sorting domain-containing protein [Armatimonadota bacterium]
MAWVDHCDIIDEIGCYLYSRPKRRQIMSHTKALSMCKTVVVAAVVLLPLLVATGAFAAPPSYVAATWNDNAVRLLDSDLNELFSFSAGASSPNGIATNGSLIWTGHFTSQEVIAYNFSGVEQFRWSLGVPGLQGMDFLNGQLAIFDATDDKIKFFDAFTGAFVRDIPGGSSSTEGLAIDGENIWQIVDEQLYLSSMADGSVIRTIPNAALGLSFDGTGLANSGLNELTLAGTDGSWYKVSKADGSVLASGNNGLDMFGLKTVPSQSNPVPEPSALVVLGSAFGTLLACRRKLR